MRISDWSSDVCSSDLTTAYTVSLGDPAKMEADARAAAKTYKLLKCKLTGEDDRERVAAVRRGAPEARLVVDANESWDELDIEAEAHALSAFGVELIEKPVSAGEEALPIGLKSPHPFYSHDSSPTREDLDRQGGAP